MIMSTFSWASWPYLDFLWTNLYLELPFFFVWVVVSLNILSHINSLYTLKINLLFIVSFVNILSHSEGCPFVLLMVSFAVQKLLCLIKFHFFILIFNFIAWGSGLKKILLWFLSQSVFLALSNKRFIVSYI